MSKLTTEQAREAWVDQSIDYRDRETIHEAEERAHVEFDDWLSQQLAEAWDEGHRAPQYRTNLNGDYLGPAKNPYRTEPHE